MKGKALPALDELMLTDALAAQKFTRKYFVAELDFSRKSLTELDALFDAVRYALRGGDTPENRDNLCKLWGAYLGEVLRRHSDGAWHNAGSEEAPVPRVRVGELLHEPHHSIRVRFEQGPSASIVTWFEQALPTPS